MRQAKSQGYKILVIYVALGSPDVNVDRVRLRVSEGGHDVPDEDIRRRYERSLAHAPEAIRLADEAVVFDNSGYQHQRLLEVREGRITWRAVRLPDWAHDIVRALLHS
jgi:predicted ABC-type ATPase